MIQARNSADAMIHSVKKSVAEHGDKLEAGEKEKIEAAVKALEEALKGEDKAAIDSKNTDLMSASQKLGEKMYADMQSKAGAEAANAGAAAPDQPGGPKPSDDDVVDAEVKEVKKA